MTREQIEEIRKGCEGVTPGKWNAAAKPSSVVGWPIVSQTGRSIASMNYVHWSSTNPAVPGDRAFNRESKSNADHIARLDPATVRSLCDLALAGLDAEARLASAYQACGALVLTLPADDPEVIALLDMLSDPDKPIPDAPWTLAAKLRVIENIDAVKSAAYHRGAADMRESAAKEADDWATPEQRQHGRGGPAAAIRSLPIEGEK